MYIYQKGLSSMEESQNSICLFQDLMLPITTCEPRKKSLSNIWTKFLATYVFQSKIVIANIYVVPTG